MARVVLARRARLELLGLEWPLIDAVQEALGLLERNPSAGHELRGRLLGLRSLRVGSYRVIYLLTDDGRTVRVAAIRHRSTAYRVDPRQTHVGQPALGARRGSTLPWARPSPRSGSVVANGVVGGPSGAARRRTDR